MMHGFRVRSRVLLSPLGYPSPAGQEGACLQAPRRHRKRYNDGRGLRTAAIPLGVPARPGEKYPQVEYVGPAKGVMCSPT
jgi:hypothetical protein